MTRTFIAGAFNALGRLFLFVGEAAASPFLLLSDVCACARDRVRP